jgi:hypothetical protein
MLRTATWWKFLPVVRRSKVRSGRSRAWRIIRWASRWATVAKRSVVLVSALVSVRIRFIAPRPGYITTGVTLKKVGGDKYPISCTQSHWSMEGRAIVREANLEQFKSHPDFADKMNAPVPPRPANHVGEWPAPIYANPLDKAKKTGAASVGHGD